MDGKHKKEFAFWELHICEKTGSLNITLVVVHNPIHDMNVFLMVGFLLQAPRDFDFKYIHSTQDRVRAKKLLLHDRVRDLELPT